MFCINKNTDKNGDYISPEYGYLMGPSSPFNENPNMIDAIWSIYGMPDINTLKEINIPGLTLEDATRRIVNVLKNQGDISNNLEVDQDVAQVSGVDSYAEALRVANNRKYSLLNKLQAEAKELQENDFKEEFQNKVREIAALEQDIEQTKDRLDSFESDDIDAMSLLGEYAQRDVKKFQEKLTSRIGKSKTKGDDIDLTLEELDGISKVLRVLKNSEELMVNDTMRGLADSNEEIAKSITRAQVIQADAQRLMGLVEKIQIDELQNFHKNTGHDFKGRETDIDSLTGMFLDISHINHPVVAALYDQIKRMSYQATDRGSKKVKELDSLFKPLAVRYGKKKVYDMIREKDENGNYTDRLVSEVDSSYFDDLYNAGVDGNRKKFLEENSSFVSPFSENSASFNLAKKNLSTEFVNEKKKEAEELLKEYDIAKDTTFEQIATKYDDPDIIIAKQEEWEYRNSPYLYAQYISATDEAATYQGDQALDLSKYKEYGIKSPYSKYLVTFPSNPKYYNKEYKAIQDDKDLKSYYDALVDSLDSIRKSVPSNKRRGIRTNTIPFVEKSIAELYSEKGFKAAGSKIMQEFRNSMYQKEDSRMFYGYQDPYDGYTENYLEPTSYRNQSLVDQRYHILASKEERDLGPEVKRELRKQAASDVANKSSDNLNSIVGSYTYMSEAYKLKSQIEDMVKISQSYLENQQEKVTLADGSKKKTIQQNLFTKGDKSSFSSMIDAVNFYVNNQFFDTKEQDNMAKSKTKTYRTFEKEEVSELEALLEDENTTEDQKEAIKSRLQKMGGYLSGANIADNAMKYVQNKGMAFNIAAGVANYVQGQTAFFTHAAGGRDFDEKQARKSWGIANRSLGKDITKEGKKMLALMNHFDVLKESSEELYSPDTFSQIKQEKFGKGAWSQRLSRYYINRKVEYLNQAPIMAAMLMKKGIWEKFEVDSDGNLSFEGLKVDQDTSKFHISSDMYHKNRMQMDQVTKKLAGNYDPYSKIQVKKTALGRAAMQFRSWIPELINERLGAEKYDPIMERLDRGRYRDLVNKAYILPTLKSIIPFVTGSIKDADGNIDELAIHNMRKNAKELQLLLSISAAVMLMSALSADDEEESWYFNLMYNQLQRAQTDMLFFFNPIEAEKISNNIVPIFGLLSDSVGILGAAYDTSIGEGEVKSGTFKGDQKLPKELFKNAPWLLPQVYKIYSMSSQIYDK